MLTTKEKVEQYTGQEFGNIDMVIQGISQYIKNFTQREFESTSDHVETRKFDGNNRTLLYVGDFLEIDEVKIGGTDVTEDILTYPANGIPKFQLHYDGGFIKGNQNIEVTAMWGFSTEVPKDIEMAATVLVAGALTPSDEAIATERIGNYQVSFKDQSQATSFNVAQETLNNYRKITI